MYFSWDTSLMRTSHAPTEKPSRRSGNNVYDFAECNSLKERRRDRAHAFHYPSTADYGRTDDVGAKFRQSEKDDWKAAPPARAEILDDTAFFACAADNSLSFGINDGGDNDDGCRNGCRIDGSSSSSSSSSSLSSSSNGTVVCPSSSTSVASVEAFSSPSPSPSSYPSSRHDKSSTTSHAAPVNQQASALGADHSGSNSVSVQEEQSSRKNPFYIGDCFSNHDEWQQVRNTAKEFSEDCEFISGDVLPGDSHARDASEIKLSLRELMRVIIIDVLKMLPNLEKIYAFGAEGFIMLDLIRPEFRDKITQEEKILHGMQLSNGWANEDQATRYVDVIDEIASILSGKDAKGFKNLEHMRKYVTIGKDRNVRYSIRSIDDKTSLGIARSLAMIADWTSTDIETIRRSLKRNDGILSLHGKPLYRISKGKVKVNDDDDEVSFGMTVAGVAAFERRKQEVNAAKQEVISILSIEGTPLGTTQSLSKAAEWTGVCERTFRDNLKRNDGILSLRGKPLYRISIVSFGMTEAGVTAFERRKQEVNGTNSRVDQKPLAKKRKLETKTKDPNTQKKSAFLHYASYAGNYIKTRNPAMKDEEIRMYVSRGWNEMTPPQRAYWDAKAKAADDEERNKMELANTNKRSHFNNTT